MIQSQEIVNPPLSRAALYVDGFNLYWSIVDLQEPFLKWSNLWRLGEIIIPQKSEQLVKTAFCTAFYPDDTKGWRHRQYIKALEAHGVSTVLGHYANAQHKCDDCGSHKWRKTEKETDINLAMAVIMDGIDDVFDTAYLLSADSDQAATAKVFRSRFPNKKLITVSPPKRNFSADILKFTDGKIALSVSHLERCVMPSVVMANGHPPVRRPIEYAPPAGWVHSDQRPK